MALTDAQKRLVAILAQRNPDPDYMIQLSDSAEFCFAELSAALPHIKADLLREKNSHESHVSELTVRLAKITTLLAAIAELEE